MKTPNGTIHQQWCEVLIYLSLTRWNFHWTNHHKLLLLWWCWFDIVVFVPRALSSVVAAVIKRGTHHLPVHVCNMHATISQKQCSSLSISFDLWNYCTRLGTLSTIVIFAFSLRKLKKAMINRWKETDPLYTIVKSYVSFHDFRKQMSCYCEVALVATFWCWNQS